MTDQALTYVELDVDSCSLTYGTAPCTASIPTTGPQRCFNSRATCQDLAHFTNVPVTLRFAVVTGHNPADIEALPFILKHSDVAITPGRISLGEDLGQRESVSINFVEAQHTDTGVGFDKYLSTRSYNPYAQGTFWAKFRARQPYLKGRPLRLYRGFVGQALADMECRHYIVDSYTGPDVSGQFTIVAKDILKLLDGDQAQAPVLSLGSLAADITNVSGSFSLAPAGIGSTYPAAGKMNLAGTEIVSFTRVGDVVTLTARGLYNTVAAAHSAADKAQVCVEYLGADPATIIADLMTTYGGIDAGSLATSSWATEVATFNRHLYSGIVTDPTPVKTLIQEFVQQAGLAIWWDPVLQQVYLQVLRAVTADARVFDESNSMGLSITEQPEKRVSRVWVSYAQRNPLDQQDLASNYRSNVEVADATAETNYGSPAITTIRSRWIAFGGQTTAQRIGNLQLGRYVNPPRKFSFEVLKNRTDVAPVLGAGYYVENPELQDFYGARATVPIQITRIRSDADRWAIEAEENSYVSYDPADNLTVVIDANIRSINLRTIYDTLYTAPQTNDVVTFVVNSGVLVGSTSNALPAVDVGSWPTDVTTGNRTATSPTLTGIADTTVYQAGMIVKGTGIPAGAKILSKTSNSITLDANATSGSGTSTSLTVYLVKLTLDVQGRVQGAGGAGSRGAQGPAGTVSTGQAGGAALHATTGLSVVIRTGGAVKGGGGGGGGAGTRVYSNHNGGGGGGGAGDVGGGGGGPGGNYAQGGQSGTLDAGGTGGLSWTTDGGLFQQPHTQGPQGGSGGAPGSAGGAGGSSDSAGGGGGAAGNAIDGISFVALSNSGTIAGPQVN